jgi:hypothetical protein
MHKLGWTHFRISGQIGGQKVTGAGTMPLIYSAVRQVAPTLHLAIGDRIQIADGLDGTWRVDPRRSLRTHYPRGSFLEGLARPWMGLHTIDIIRRDAAARQVEFQTRLSHDRNRSQVMAVSDNLRIVYTIDMNQDWIESISLAVQQPSGDWKDTGLLSFSYDQLSSPQDHRIDTRPVQGQETDSPPGIQWLMTLATPGGIE